MNYAQIWQHLLLRDFCQHSLLIFFFLWLVLWGGKNKSWHMSNSNKVCLTPLNDNLR